MFKSILILLLLMVVVPVSHSEEINNNKIIWNNNEQISSELRIEIERNFINPILKSNKKKLVQMILDPNEGSFNEIGIKIKWLNGDWAEGLLRYTGNNKINNKEYMEWQYPCNSEVEVCE